MSKVVQEIKQLRVSRAREETVRAKRACVGGSQKKLARAEIKSLSERIKDQGENTAERRDSVKTPVERPWQRQGQSGILYEEAKRFLAGTSDFMGFGYSRIEQRHGGVRFGMKLYGRKEEAMVQQNTRRRGRNRKPRWEPG